MADIRSPAVAGLFYPADTEQLAQEVRHLLDMSISHGIKPKALIVPHAGYVYSGAVAATAYAALGPMVGVIKHVVLLGPAHRVAVQGLALPGVGIFETPLGKIRVDQPLVDAIADLPQVVVSPEAHAWEHSLEVQLPFLQSVLGEFTLLPLVAGMASPESVAQVLEAVWGGEETLIVVSSDLSHYLSYSAAQRTDHETVQDILQLRQPLGQHQACGNVPVNGLMIAARKHHLAPHLLDLQNSGDTAGPRDRVVGYAAIAFDEGGDGNDGIH